MAGLSEASRKYFATLNSTADRIHRDAAAFAELLGERWKGLSERERDCLIDDYIVPPEVRDRYGSDSWNDESAESSFFPRVILQSGGGSVLTADEETWDDEHSGPFSWETRSQNELSLEELLSERPRQHLKDPKRCKSPVRAAGGGSTATIAPRIASSNVQLDVSSTAATGSGTDFDQLRSMWEQGNVTGTSNNTSGDAVDAAVPTSVDRTDGTLQPPGTKSSSVLAVAEDPRGVVVAAPAASESTKEACSSREQSSDVVAAVAAADARSRRGGTLPSAGSRARGAAGAAAATSTGVDVGGPGTRTTNVNDDPVFVQHGVTFGTARSATTSGRGGQGDKAARPQSGNFKSGVSQSAKFVVSSSSTALVSENGVKTGFDFLDDW